MVEENIEDEMFLEGKMRDALEDLNRSWRAFVFWHDASESCKKLAEDMFCNFEVRRKYYHLAGLITEGEYGVIPVI